MSLISIILLVVTFVLILFIDEKRSLRVFILLNLLIIVSASMLCASIFIDFIFYLIKINT